MNSKKVTLVSLMAVLLMITVIIAIKKHPETKQETEEIQSETEYVQEAHTESAVETAMEDINRSLVRVAVKQSAGTGIIWAITEDEVVIASNRHVLMGDVEAEVTFGNGDVLTAYALGYSAQYDVAFFKIEIKDITQELLQYIAEVRKPLEISLQERSQSGTPVIQAGANGEYYEGTITQLQYIPEFGTDMLCTSCYAKAGMSGGGVFDGEGWLLGMVTGGEAADTQAKESWSTYSIPTTIIEEEYQALLKNQISNE